ncbi:unnamed protein product [Penicillium camemberti]|uniref:Str. FM013 n=1 Tax=Penicillium camemberti (strain FM 013) TaxID=1429867 RepID=A0A0G4PLV9_PENC3|nr:unnamed protein product [Penicillium camemberti]
MKGGLFEGKCGVWDVPAETLGFADVPAETLFVADVPAETLGVADVPARRFVDAGPSLRRTCTLLHRWARGSDSRGHGDAQARRQERDIVTQRSVRTEVLILLGWESGPFYIFSATSRPRNQLRRW